MYWLGQEGDGPPGGETSVSKARWRECSVWFAGTHLVQRGRLEQRIKVSVGRAQEVRVQMIPAFGPGELSALERGSLNRRGS